MRTFTRMIFARQKAYNTYIGGVSSIVTSISDLATFLGVSTSIIKYFKNDGTNIEAYITANYTLPNTKLVGVTALTYFIDVDGRLTVINVALNSNTNLKQLYVPKLAIVGAGGGFTSFFGNSAIPFIRLDGTTLFQHGAFNTWTNLKNLIAPALTNIFMQNATRSSMQGMTNLRRLYIPLASIDWWYAGVTTLSGVRLNGTIYCSSSLSNNQRANARITILASPNVVAGDTVTVNGLTYTAVTSGAGVGQFNIGINGFASSQALSSAIVADARIGTIGDINSSADGSGVCSVFSTLSGTGSNAVTLSTSAPSRITLSSPTLLGGGNMHPLLEYLESRGWTVVYKTDWTLPSAPTALSAASITTTSFQLNFTPPTPNVNGTTGYEVWIDDGETRWMPYVQYEEVLASGSTISGLTSGRTYRVKLRTFDGQYNLSSFSTELIVNTL